MKERLKNPVLWGSILSTIFLILSASGIINISDSTLNTIINSILSILALVGVINNPTSLTNYPREDLTNEDFSNGEDNTLNTEEPSQSSEVKTDNTINNSEG